MASVACRFIPVILVQVRCSLNKEKTKQYGKDQGRCSAQALPEPVMARSGVSFRAELYLEWVTHGLHLQNVAFAGDDFIQNGIHEKAQEQTRYQSGNHYDRKRLLGVATHARGKGRRQQA